ncbi:hypothetical protein [Saccharothrix variisporea]|uniref:Uncharacterized protein n=1 Tax=Saccharothrix variisporea TaxID=543527 RepID=A0A495X8L3_9PSEU|nr:hypothetical protein [Saccharothrix variisporea]RKT69696.1 hypothetical protein DFJ66_2934 [Saccharothrix variisporea]
MPIPDALKTGLADPKFWAMYCFEDDHEGYDEYFDEDSHVLSFPVGGGYSLDLDISDSYFDLGLRVPGADEPVTVGWSDEAHFHPHALRWDELDLVCRAASLLEPELRHPGPGLALLSRFVVISAYDDITTIESLLHAAFTTLKPADAEGYWPDAEDIAGRVDYRRQAVVWHRDVDGNFSVHKDISAFDGADLYSTRTRGSDFPWADWRSKLDQAERTLAAAVDPTWLEPLAVGKLLDRAIADRDPTAAPELGRTLADLGCANPTILTALTAPVHPAETTWVLELLSTAPRGTLLRGLPKA